MSLDRCEAPVHLEKCPPNVRAGVVALSHVSLYISVWFSFLFFFFPIPYLLPCLDVPPPPTFSLAAFHWGHSGEHDRIPVLKDLTFQKGETDNKIPDKVISDSDKDYE